MKLALLALGLIALGGCAVGPDGYVRPDGYYSEGYPGTYDSAYYDDGYYYGACGDCGSVSVGVGYGYGYGYPVYGYPYYGYPYYGGYYPYYGGYYGHHHHDRHDDGDHDGDDHHGSWHNHDHDGDHDPDAHDHDGTDRDSSPLAWRQPEQVPVPHRNGLSGQGGFAQTPMYRAPATRIAPPARGSGSSSVQPSREPPHVSSRTPEKKQQPR